MDAGIMDTNIMRIGDRRDWVHYFKTFSMNKAVQRTKLIADGKLRLNYVVYEKGVSFKCICNKWVHPVKSRPSCVRVHIAQVGRDDWDSLAMDGKGFSERRGVSSPMIVCGLCSDICVFCDKATLLMYHKTRGCCHECLNRVLERIFKMQFTIQRRIIDETSWKNSIIAQICKDNPFRGFTDFATEYRVRKQREVETQFKKKRAIQEHNRRQLILLEEKRKKFILLEENRKKLILEEENRKKLILEEENRKKLILAEENRKKLVLAEENRKKLGLWHEHRRKVQAVRNELTTRKRRYPSSHSRTDVRVKK